MVMWRVFVVVLLLFHDALAQTCTTGSTRLFQFTNTYAGVVEVCLNGVWGTVCADSPTTLWSEKNAQVFCRGLGYSGALNPVDQSTLPSSYIVNPATTPINYKSVRCNGTETSLSQCSHSENTTGCTHASDAAVVCRQSASDGDLRLVGSTANGQGAVEIYSMASQQWYRVCPTVGWTSSYASVACQQLGYQSGVAFTYSLTSGISQKSSVYCLSTRCYTSSTCTDTSNNYAGVICNSSSSNSGTVRLSGGSRASTGRVEVLYNGVWGTVCSYSSSWTLTDGQVVCAQLGYKNLSTVSISPTISTSDLSSLYPIWLSGVACSSLNTNITQCAYSKPIGYGQYCTHTYDALLDCQSTSSSDSSSVPLGALGALAVVAAAPVAAVRYCEPLCKFLGQCARCLECFSWVWLQGMWANLRLLLCCCFLTSLVRSASRERFIEHDDVVVEVVTTTTPTVATTQSPKPESELVQAPPPGYNEAINYSSPEPSAPPPQYTAPPPQYTNPEVLNLNGWLEPIDKITELGVVGEDIAAGVTNTLIGGTMTELGLIFSFPFPALLTCLNGSAFILFLRRWSNSRHVEHSR